MNRPQRIPETATPAPPPAEDFARLTPSMAQFMEIKASNQDCLLFYRMGDFYELFFEDAEIASRTLGIVLTKRGKHGGQDIPMCGVPVARSEDYLNRLIAAGHRVAVCEQMEDPAEARKRGSKSVVSRDVVRLVTPGTVTEENLLEPGRASLLLAVSRIRAGESGYFYGLAAVDISTGHFTVSEASDTALAAEIARLEPREIVVPDQIHGDEALHTLWRETRAAVTPVARQAFDTISAERDLAGYFGVRDLAGFGAFSRSEIAAAALAVHYVERTQLRNRPPLSPPRQEKSGGAMQIDAATRANLELTRRLSGERQGSLLATIDLTLTPSGGRLLAERLAGPLTEPAEINRRLDAIALFLADDLLTRDITERLKRVPDIARALSRLALDRGGPRDLASIGAGIAAAADIGKVLAKAGELPPEIAGATEAITALDPALAPLLASALDEELPLQKRDGGFIRAGFDAALDETRGLRDESRRIIAELQARYVAETDCRTLRVKHNNFLGYFVEVPQAIGEKLLREAIFIHRQTMAGAMRFTTTELGELEGKIVSAADRALALEIAHFDRLVAAVLAQGEALKAVADAIAAIDVASSLGVLAEKRDWVRPTVDASHAFAIRGGRHPVVEQALLDDGKSFVANDCDLSPPDSTGSGRVFLVTGPNMAGKSTFLRQNALIAVLAQMGAYVPAEAAHIGVVDRLFSRVGAADDLARGRSTFMVEMVETAAILNQAGPGALVILDEIGRGTATFDGLSIAWAAIEHLHETNRCRALFATHYHELTQLTKRLNRLANLTMRVTEWQGEVVFLHEVAAGAADRSYGIQVAKLAGLPASVVARAKHVLAELEQADRQAPTARLLDELPLFAAAVRAAPAEKPEVDLLRSALEALHPDEMSPREALEALYRLKALGKG